MKCLGPALLHVWNKFMISALAMHRKIRVLLELSNKLDDIIDQYPFPEFITIPEEAMGDLLATAHAFVSLLIELETYFGNDPDLKKFSLFVATVKVHFLLHCCYQARYLNPRGSWCFTGEDFMGKCRPLAGSCSNGRSTWQVCQAMLAKYMFAFHMTFTDTNQWTRK